jgi:ATP-dependent Zn protease
MSPRATPSELDRQIAATHRRFVKAMEERVTAMTDETKEAYFALLSKLVEKLENPERALREIVQEMMAEAMTELLHLMQG